MHKRTYSTILFDFDGCIANSLPVWLKSFRKTFETLKVTMSDRDIIDIAFHRWDEKPELKIVDLNFFRDDLYLNFHKYSKDLQLHDGFLETIKELRKDGIKTAVVTSTLRKTIDEMLVNLSCQDLFDTTISWEDTDKNKPDPDPIIIAMDHLKATPNETIMIGDNEVDIMAGISAGVTSVWYYPQTNELYYPDNKFAFRKPHFTIKHFKELLDIV